MNKQWAAPFFGVLLLLIGLSGCGTIGKGTIPSSSVSSPASSASSKAASSGKAEIQSSSAGSAPAGSAERHTTGDVTFALSDDFTVADSTQSVAGIPIQMTQGVNSNGQVVTVGSAHLGTKTSPAADDETSMSGSLSAMLGSLKEGDPNAAILKESEMDYVEVASIRWAHKNIALKTKGMVIEIDVFINNVPGAQYSVNFITSDGDNQNLIEEVLSTFQILARTE